MLGLSWRNTNWGGGYEGQKKVFWIPLKCRKLEIYSVHRFSLGVLLGGEGLQPPPPSERGGPCTSKAVVYLLSAGIGSAARPPACLGVMTQGEGSGRRKKKKVRRGWNCIIIRS